MDRDVLDRAVEAAARAMVNPHEAWDLLSEGERSDVRREARVAVEAAVPVIVAAAVKEERERIRAEVEKQRVHCAPDETELASADQDWNEAIDEALAAIDKEGEGE